MLPGKLNCLIHLRRYPTEDKNQRRVVLYMHPGVNNSREVDNRGKN